MDKNILLVFSGGMNAALGGSMFYILYRIHQAEKLLLMEPNPSILAAEMAMMVGIVALGVVAMALGIRRLAKKSREVNK